MFPESHQDLLLDEKRAAAYLATVMPDGSTSSSHRFGSHLKNGANQNKHEAEAE